MSTYYKTITQDTSNAINTNTTYLKQVFMCS